MTMFGIGGRSASHRAVAWSLVLLVALVVIAVFALYSGAAGNDSVVIWNIRAPRVATAAAVGAGLAIAGVLLQGALRNPLADPALVGVSAGAALGAVVAAALGISYNTFLSACIAVLAASIAIGLVLWVARSQGRIEVVTVLLGGIAMTAFAAAVVSVIVTTSDLAGSRTVSFWTTGSFALANWSGFISMIPALVLGTAIGLAVARPLDIFALGDSAAFASGVPVAKIRIAALLAAVLLTATGVAVVGIIAFVGLLVPHAVRLLIGPSHRALIIVSGLAGALVLVLADTAARLLLSPIELPVGAVTAIVGAPLFLVLVSSTRARQGGWA